MTEGIAACAALRGIYLSCLLLSSRRGGKTELGMSLAFMAWAFPAYQPYPLLFAGGQGDRAYG
jgi:hypothetical protein